MDDLISRQAAIDLVRDVCNAIMSGCNSHYDSEVGDEVYDDILEVDAILKCNKEIRIALEHLQPAQPDLSEYSDKLWRNAYERGKADAKPERKTGKWIPVDSYSAFGGDEVMWEAHGNPIAFYYCSECKEHAYAGEDGESLLTTYCPNCGADMRGKER